MTTAASPPAAWNPLALASFLFSLVFVAGAVAVQLAGGVFQPVYSSTPPAYHVGVALLQAGVLTVPLAIFSGHAALDRAKRRSHRWPLRGLAILGLMLGYGALVAYCGGIAVYCWGVTHARWHLVG